MVDVTSCISLSLYGDKPWYGQGAIENVRLAKVFYPGWSFRVHLDATVPQPIVEELMAEGADVRKMNPSSRGHTGMFWRLLVASDSTIDRWIIRDADSRIGPREADAVGEWMESKLPFHVMRDHYWHNKPIMGGMWGGSGAILSNMEEWLAIESRHGGYGEDEDFLARTIWPIIKNNTLEHDSRGTVLCGQKQFRISGEFVGKQFNRHDLPNGGEK
jgi:hypothetical protein